MSTDANRPDNGVEDQDAEPTLNAPEAERPDGLDALKEGDEEDEAGSR